MKIEGKKLISVDASDVKNGGLTIPKKVKEIGDSAIKKLEELIFVKAPGVTSMGNDNFYECNALAAVEFPVLTSMGNYNLYECNALAAVEFPVLTSMGNYNFYECNALAAVEFPVLTSMGNDNFRVCNALAAVEFGKVKLNTKCVDGYLFVVESSKTSKGIKIYSGYNLKLISNGDVHKDVCFVSEKEGFTSHGTTVRQSINDLQFKIVSEKLKKDPINEDTEFTVEYYRLLTGACDFGCRSWMKSHGIGFKVLNPGTAQEKTKELEPIKAIDLLPILEKSNAYGLSKIKHLVTFKIN